MRRGFAIATLLLVQALPAAAQTTAPASGSAACQLLPIASTHAIPPYPPVSQATREEGTTTLKVLITPDGSVSDSSVEHTSGSLRLDDAATAFVKENWRWQPLAAACGAGASTLVSIVWHLKNPAPQFTPVIDVTLTPADYPDGALARLEQGNVAIQLLLSDTGQIIQSRVINSSGFADLDAKALQIAQTRWTWTPPRMSGQPAKSVIVLSLKFAPPAAKN
jgi:TonB family protein